MSTEQMRELDLWIHKHVLEADLFVGLKKRGLWYRPNAKGYTSQQAEAGRYTRAEAKKHEYPHDEPVVICEFEPEHYTTDPAAAMLVLERCYERLGGTLIAQCKLGYDYIVCVPAYGEPGITAKAPTLPLAIAKFARQLFTK